MFEGITDASSMDSEMGLPILLATIPCWINGINAFIPFSAILSTADSCLMAAPEISLPLFCQIFQKS
jgi:SSS family solute:Na+ symporter